MFVCICWFDLWSKSSSRWRLVISRVASSSAEFYTSLPPQVFLCVWCLIVCGVLRRTRESPAGQYNCNRGWQSCNRGWERQQSNGPGRSKQGVLWVCTIYHKDPPIPPNQRVQSEGALGWVTLTSKKVLSIGLNTPVAAMSIRDWSHFSVLALRWSPFVGIKCWSMTISLLPVSRMISASTWTRALTT